jgi:hypothetical protein
MNDALEILNELQIKIDNTVNNSGLVDVWVIQNFIDSKIAEFEPIKGDCAG